MDDKKPEHARIQLQIWDLLLEGRIELQKAIVASRKLEKAFQGGENSTDKHVADEKTIKTAKKLLTCLVRLRDTYRQKSQFCIEDDTIIEDNDDDDDDDVDANIEGEDVVKKNQSNDNFNIDDDILTQKYEKYTKLRNDTIEKWYEKTKIGTIAKKGYTALELPTLQLIENSLKDKERLIRRTQLDRSSHIDNDINPETFNDDDFYHQQLKEIINKEESSKWVDLQRTKYKIKRKADTKATKGRKIKKDLIRKLVNFMAPTVPVNKAREEPMPDQIRDELMRSLFGV